MKTFKAVKKSIVVVKRSVQRLPVLTLLYYNQIFFLDKILSTFCLTKKMCELTFLLFLRSIFIFTTSFSVF